MPDYTHNHYAPISYQRRFMLPGQGKYHRLDLYPKTVNHGSHKYTRKDYHHWGPDQIFAENDLYTTKWGTAENTEIEQFFFGQLDDVGVKAIDFIRDFDHDDRKYDNSLFRSFLRYMSVQKLRTPKGLAAFGVQAQSRDKNATLLLLQQMQEIYCATWTECIWQIADASESAIKFIISDHPVTVYNRACPHLSKYCIGANDPDVRFHATHTMFPLSLDKILILTNLSWVRNPYQNEVRFRPNAGLLRDAMFSFLSIQIGRKLTEDEVLQINLITKRRAYRYVAAAEKEWLYPERRVSTDHWKKLGDGYLLMPEPRLVHMGGEVVIGFKGGGSDAFSAYGHKPGQRGFRDARRDKKEGDALERSKAEWAMMHGAKYTAYSNDFGGKLREDSAEMMDERKKRYDRYYRK